MIIDLLNEKIDKDLNKEQKNKRSGRKVLTINTKL